MNNWLTLCAVPFPPWLIQDTESGPQGFLVAS